MVELTKYHISYRKKFNNNNNNELQQAGLRRWLTKEAIYGS